MMSLTSGWSAFWLALHVYSLIGLGGVVCIAAIAIAFIFPRVMFAAAIVAVSAGAATSFYAKGVHDNAILRDAQSEQATEDALANAARVRQEAEADVRKQIASEPQTPDPTPAPLPPKKPRSLVRRLVHPGAASGVRHDPYDRDPPSDR